jgi:hypothetical protein
MKTKILLVGITVGILGFFSNLNAQVTSTSPLWTGTIATSAFVDSFTELGTPKPVTNVDTVTVGATMPYYVNGDPNMHMLRQWGAITAKSTYSWTVPVASTATITGSDSLVSVKWPLAGTYRLTVKENPGAVATGYPTLCPSVPYAMDVKVLNRPTVAWNGTTPVAGGCGVSGGTPITVPIDLKGIGQWEVDYTVQYFNLANQEVTVAGITRAASEPAVLLGAASNKNDGTALANQSLLSISIPADKSTGDYGKYVITITSISDRISRKSGIPSEATDIPSVSYTIYSMPTPTTQPIQHIKNL